MPDPWESHTGGVRPTAQSPAVPGCGAAGRILVALAAALLVARGAAALTPAEMEPHRKTIEDIQAVGSAVMSWLSDQVALVASPEGPAAAACKVDLADYSAVSAAELVSVLVPQYIAAIPLVDGWGNPYDYYLEAGDLTSRHLALIRSGGSDGVFEGSSYVCGDVSTLAEDMVWADGYRIRRPGTDLIDLRQRQVRLYGDVRNVGTAMASWFTDQVARPASPLATSTVDLGLYTPISAGDLAQLLVPQYILWVPANDPWGLPMDYYLDRTDFLGPQVMAVRSRGRFGVAEGEVYTIGTFPAGELQRDTVWTDGVFARSPDDLGALVFLDDFEGGDLRFWSAAALADEAGAVAR